MTETTTVTVKIDGQWLSYCSEHATRVDWKGNDEDGITMWVCPEGHVILEES